MKKIFSNIKNPAIFRPLIAVVVVLLVIGGFLFYQKKKQRVSIDTSVVSAPIVNIAPPTTGKMTELDVYEDQEVRKGDPLAQIGDQTMYADTDGLVVMANNQVGGSVSPQTTIIQLINPNELRIAGTLDENKGLSAVKIGQVVSFTIDAYPGRTYWGFVDEVSPSAKQTQAAFSISSERPTQQFVVYARFDSHKYPEIKNGMSAKMTVFTDTN